MRGTAWTVHVQRQMGSVVVANWHGRFGSLKKNVSSMADDFTTRKGKPHRRLWKATRRKPEMDSKPNLYMPSSTQDPVLSRLFSANREWSDKVEQVEPGFFKNSATGQQPKVLWIGCADSRVPESVITAARPGDIFVHRNIANQFHPDDVSANSVLQYAVNEVGVEHVVIAGHTRCGGASACLAACAKSDSEHLIPVPHAPLTDPINVWLLPMARLAVSLGLEPSSDRNALDVLVEENVKLQVKNLVHCEILKKAWEAGKKVTVHGWVYDLELGRLKDLNVTTGPH